MLLSLLPEEKDVIFDLEWVRVSR